MNFRTMSTAQVEQVKKHAKDYLQRTRQDIPETMTEEFIKRTLAEAKGAFNNRYGLKQQNPDREDFGSGINQIYCLRCKKHTPSTNLKTITYNHNSSSHDTRKRQQASCADCGCKKSKFVSKK